MTHDQTMSIQTIIDIAKNILLRIDDMKIKEIVDKLDAFLSKENINLMEALAKDSDRMTKDADKTFKNINRMSEVVEKLRGI